MSSEARKAANRQNALKSTGPRTDRGKPKSRLNALKHGVYAATPVLPGEDDTAYRAIAKSNMDHFAPVGPVEDLLVRQITAQAWKLQRIERAAIALHVHMRDSQIVRFLATLSPSEYGYVRSEYKVELEDQIKQRQQEHETNARAARPSLLIMNEDPAKGARELDREEKMDVEARLNRVLEVNNIILAGWVPSTETAPQASLDQESQATVRTYLAYAAKLQSLQAARLTVTLVASTTASDYSAKRGDAKYLQRSSAEEIANQNQLKPDNDIPEK